MNDKQAVQVFKTLMEGRASRLELAELVGANPKSVGRLLTEMKAQKMIYVIDYSNATDGRNRVKIYAIGDYEDAQPVQSKSQEERSRKSYIKKKAARNTYTPKTKLIWNLWQ
jgi:transcription initiation factor IIE alpha subunit